MGNLFVNLPAAAADGAGAGQSTAGMGAKKTITVLDAFTGAVNIEASLDGGTTWAQVATFLQPSKKTLEFAADEMRTVRSGTATTPGLPNVDVGGSDSGSLFGTPAVPAGNGAGAQLDVSLLGSLNTVIVSGTFTGGLNIQISEDGTNWMDCMTFHSAGVQSKSFVTQFVRVARADVGATPGTPVVTIGAANDEVKAFASGSATLANATTSIIVNHTLPGTPGAGDIQVTPIEAWGAAVNFWVDTITATQFTINVDADPTQDVDFGWQATL